MQSLARLVAAVTDRIQSLRTNKGFPRSEARGTVVEVLSTREYPDVRCILSKIVSIKRVLVTC